MELGSLSVGACLGLLVALAANLLADVVKARRNLKASACLVLDELDRLSDYYEQSGGLQDDARRQARFNQVLDDYRRAIFAADRAAFEEHLSLYREMVPAVESVEDLDRQEFFLSVSTRKRLRELVGDRFGTIPAERS